MIDLDKLHPDNLDDEHHITGVSYDLYEKVYEIAQDAVARCQVARLRGHTSDNAEDFLGELDSPEARTQPDESAFHAGWGRAQSGQFDEPRDAYEDYKAASREARTQPETGQPASNYSPQLARRDDQFFRQGVASERQAIRERVEAAVKAATWKSGDHAAGADKALALAVRAIEGGEDE